MNLLLSWLMFVCLVEPALQLKMLDKDGNSSVWSLVISLQKNKSGNNLNLKNQVEKHFSIEKHFRD